MKTVAAVGLKTATKAEIEDLIADYSRKGFAVHHKTHRNDDGTKLPHNGILIIRK